LATSCSGQPEAEASPTAGTAAGTIVRLDPALDQIVPGDAQIERLQAASHSSRARYGGRREALWFSDVVGNRASMDSDGKVIKEFSGQRL
jgi:hypothetical protein